MLEQLTEKALKPLQESLPAIQKLIQAKAPAFIKAHGLKGLQYVTESDRLRPLFETVYQSLPLPLRLLVKQDTFVKFCLSQKENLLGDWLAPEEKADLPAETQRTTTRKTKSAEKEDSKVAVSKAKAGKQNSIETKSKGKNTPTRTGK